MDLPKLTQKLALEPEVGPNTQVPVLTHTAILCTLSKY